MKQSVKLTIFIIILIECLSVICISEKTNKLKEVKKNEKKHNLKKLRFKQSNNTLAPATHNVGNDVTHENVQEVTSVDNNIPDHQENIEAESNHEQANEADQENMRIPELPNQMPHELEEELEALKENEGFVNNQESNTIPQQSTTNVDDMIKNDPILGEGKKSSQDDDVYKEEVSPLDFF